MNQAKAYFCKIVDSPVGRLRLLASDDGLAAVGWHREEVGDRGAPAQAASPPHPVLVEAERQIDEYFAGQRTVFDLELDFSGTEFQRAVWAALLTIPFGETRSYGEIARQIGRPKAVRAVGAANGRNPIAIVAPCHRVIGSDGTLTGFGGGLAVKAKLLELERRSAEPETAQLNFS